MPPKVKYTREQIVSAALEMTRENGIGAVSARTLGKRLHCSSQPIFLQFENMDALRAAVIRAAKDRYAAYVRIGLSCVPAFKGAGMQYIRFAREEPQLFALLFQSAPSADQPPPGDLMLLDENREDILQSIVQTYALSEQQAWWLYRHLSIYAHGIASLLVQKTCQIEEDAVSQMLTEVFTALLIQCRRKEGTNE